MPVTVVDHPLIKHKLGLMREKDVSVKDFRDLASELASLLTYEATKDLETEIRTIDGWAGVCGSGADQGEKNYGRTDPASRFGNDGRRA